MTRQLRADRQAISLELLVLDNEGLNLSFRSRDFVQFGQVEFPELFNVDRSAVDIGLVVESETVTFLRQSWCAERQERERAYRG